jgi:nucleoside-diphosphate-sugar epimerase
MITGGTGAVGPAVAQAFQEVGYNVTVASRNATSGALRMPGVTYAELDVTEAKSFGSLFQDATVVVHLASLLHINNPRESLQADYERVNVGGTRTVMEVARAHGVRRVIVASSISAYGYDRGEILTENSEPRPDSLYGRSKLAAEKVALAFTDESGAPLATVLRLSAVYGAGMKGNYMTLLHALAKKRFIAIGPGGNARTLVHAQDVARAILLTAESDEAAGQIYNVTDGEVHALQSVIEAMCDALGRPTPRLALPIALVRTGAFPADLLLRIAGSPKRISTLLDKYLEDVRVSGQKLAQQLGFSPRFDLKAGWKDTVDRLRASGDLPPR